MKRRRDSTITIPVVGGDEMEGEGLKNKRGKERERDIGSSIKSFPIKLKTKCKKK